LRGIQAGLRTGPPAKQSALKVATVVCLVLLALLAVIQVMHVHASDSDADHCPLCVAMHSVVPFVIMLIAVVLVRIGTPTPIIPQFRAISRYGHPTLFTRPPPAGF
jgi:p-aminobenzoyl-glutamate transporter AbgT